MTFAWAAVPDNWRENGNTLIWLAAVISAAAVICAVVWKIRPLRKFPRWFWQHTWGRDERGRWNTPVPRFKRWMTEAMEPMFIEQRSEVAGQLEAFRTENSEQHSVVVHRLTAVEVELASLAARVAALEAVQMRSSSGGE